MTHLTELKKHLKVGQIYRRSELSKYSKSIDKQINELIKQGFLDKISRGMYYVSKNSVFGKVPPNEDAFVRIFLKGDRFLLISPNFYNSLGVGTSQLYNKKIVYNHKRRGKFKLGNREFEFQIKHHFPAKVTEEFLLVDLANNIDDLAEDRNEVLNKLLDKAAQMPPKKLKNAIMKYGNIKTKKLLKSLTINPKYTKDGL